MPVFDFSDTPAVQEAICTYEVFYSNEHEATPAKPIMILDDKGVNLQLYPEGVFLDPALKTAFEAKVNGAKVSSDILKID